MRDSGKRWELKRRQKLTLAFNHFIANITIWWCYTRGNINTHLGHNYYISGIKTCNQTWIATQQQTGTYMGSLSLCLSLGSHGDSGSVCPRWGSQPGGVLLQDERPWTPQTKGCSQSLNSTPTHPNSALLTPDHDAESQPLISFQEQTTPPLSSGPAHIIDHSSGTNLMCCTESQPIIMQHWAVSQSGGHERPLPVFIFFSNQFYNYLV